MKFSPCVCSHSSCPDHIEMAAICQHVWSPISGENYCLATYSWWSFVYHAYVRTESDNRQLLLCMWLVCHDKVLKQQCIACSFSPPWWWIILIVSPHGLFFLQCLLPFKGYFISTCWRLIGWFSCLMKAKVFAYLVVWILGENPHPVQGPNMAWILLR